ncbi:hypothetical protein V2I01_05945 [Micromonospora sp. BRA006-A]|nr:hypothetical protein [Micromonospora sp. BRA006-A]
MQTDRSATQPPRSPRPAGPRLLYARPGIVVTAERFTVGRNTWPVAEITQLRIDRGRTTGSRSGPSPCPAR